MIWFYKYHGLALARENGPPIHSRDIGFLPPPEKLLKMFPGIELDNIRLASMPEQEFFARKWPV